MNGLLCLVINFKLRERSLAAFGSLTANMPVWLAWIAALKKFRTIRMWLGENGDPYRGIAMWPSLSIYEKAVWRRCMTFHPPPFPLSLLRSPTPVNLTLSSHGQVEREITWWNRMGTETRIQKPRLYPWIISLCQQRAAPHWCHPFYRDKSAFQRIISWDYSGMSNAWS